MSGIGTRVTLVLGSLATGVGGWFGAGQLHRADDTSGIAVGATSIYDCPVAGGAAIGVVSAGEELELLAVTGDRWAVIRHPANANQLAWIPLAMVDTDANAGDLPELTCGPEAAEAPTTTAAATTTTLASATTTSSTTTTSTSTTTTSIATTSTVSGDVTPPTVTVTANRAYLYVPPVNAACTGEDQLEVTVVVADPTLPISIQSVQAAWTGPSGAQTAALTPIGGNRFRLQITSNGPNSNDLPVTITATGSDGAGNVGSGQLVVSLRRAASYGCG